MNETYAIRQWKTEMKRSLQMRYGNKYSGKELDIKLDVIIRKRLKNPNLTVFNNYTNTALRTNALDLIDSIESKNIVIGSGGCLFLPHETKSNILILFILEIMQRRKDAKNERKKYEKGTDEWLHWDIMQLLWKLVINSLYGCLGYPGFTLYNVFTAEAITNGGKHIITTAINVLEGFLGDAMFFVTNTELYHFLYNIHEDYKEKYDAINISAFGNRDWLFMTYDRLLSKCKFNMTDKDKADLYEVLLNKDTAELIILYYKNNLLEFSKLDFIKAKYRYVVENNGLLTFCETHLLKTDTIREVVQDIWRFYDIFVLYDYPVHDRLRKAMYLPKSRCLYTDTDSVFMSLSHFVEYMKTEVFPDYNPLGNVDDLRFTAVNLILIHVNMAIDRGLKSLCRSLKIPDEYAGYLNMKNEFYGKRMVFVTKKKRYLAWMMLQEGELLNRGKGLPEIKGFDFRKSTTKPYLTDFYTQLSMDEILTPDEISLNRIFVKMCNLKKDIEEGTRHGDPKFYKQAKVKTVEDYKNPYSTQAITAVLLWNAICPQAEIEMPGDVNIVPINSLTWPKKPQNHTGVLKADSKYLSPLNVPEIKEFAEKYPDIYQRLENEIYRNPNEAIRHMSMNSIALPKNTNIEIPQYVYDLIRTDDIVNNAMMLFLPITNILGLRSLPTSNKTEHLSNIIDL